MRLNALVYDIEILKGILGRQETKQEGVEYCEGWHDKKNMGVTVVGAYDYLEERYRVFCGDNAGDFLKLIAERHPLCIGFNNKAFDNEVMRATEGWDAPADDECYDILVETWLAAGLGPVYQSSGHNGYGLDAMCHVNFGTRKSGNGAMAPVLWQRGNIGEVIDYCLNDVKLTKQLFDVILAGRPLKHPKGGPDLLLRKPL